MKILVTGGAGFIGSRCVTCLVAAGLDVAILDLKEPPDLACVPFHRIDLLDRSRVEAALRGVDVVYHFGGPVVEGTRRNLYAATLVQLAGTLNVLEGCRNAGPRKIVLASTVSVYAGIEAHAVVTEESPLELLKIRPFGAAKLMAEHLVHTYAKRFALEYVILRIGSTYGPGHCTNAVKALLERGFDGQPLEIWGTGMRRNQYTWVEDVTDGAFRALNASNETFNLVSPEETSSMELGRLLSAMYGFSMTFKRDQPEGLQLPFISPRKAVQQLGWTPVTLRVGIARMVQEMRQSPPIAPEATEPAPSEAARG